ncbi:MAG: ABC transporter permease subunit [Halofilum sp. (in: g-proteobacteria)]|nr:ABC transporter permease subunit [Halofilum sp. (in: g-proteobacteria)]
MFDLHGFGQQLLSGALITLELGVLSMAVAVGLGLVFAPMKAAPIAPLRWIATTYTTVVRGLPELLIILLVFFGASRALSGAAEFVGYEGRVELSAFAAGMMALGFAYGAYTTETIRGALLAIPKGQVEAARAIGMNGWLTFRRVILPQLWRIALPGLGNLFLGLLKDTALVSVIGVEDLTREAAIATGFTKEPFTFYFAATILYLCMTVLCVTGIHYMEKLAGRGYAKGST